MAKRKTKKSDEAAVAQIMLDLPRDLNAPEGLSARGMQAWNCIVQFLAEHGLIYTGGCEAFRNPKDWDGDYGKRSVLVVLHEGSEVGRAFSYDYCYEHGGGRPESYKVLEKMSDELAKIGLYAEQCTRTYSAVYEIR